MAAMAPLLPPHLLQLLPDTLLHALVYESGTMLQMQLRPGFMLQAVSESMQKVWGKMLVDVNQL